MTNPVITETGHQYWKNSEDKFHREDGPAWIGVDGSQSWCINGKCHRTDGPAIIHVNGTQEWYLNDKRHRTDGPSFISANGIKQWWVNDHQVCSNKEYQEAANLTDEGMTLLILKYGNVK